MPTPTQPVVLDDTGTWKVTADGKLRLGCCGCPECACCFDGDTPGGHCSNLTWQECAELDGEWLGSPAESYCPTCYEAFMSGECIYGYPPSDCNACSQPEMPVAILATAFTATCCVRPGACQPSDGPNCEERIATCQWKAAQMGGAHVLTPSSAAGGEPGCVYAKTWHLVGPDGWLATFSVTVIFDRWGSFPYGWRGYISSSSGTGGGCYAEFGPGECHGFSCTTGEGNYETCVDATGPGPTGPIIERLVVLQGAGAGCSF